jgi:predicted FMN-binding regulatory protein PaiB
LTGGIQPDYEQAMPRPWPLDGSIAFSRRMLAQIVSFKNELERIEGKWKLNQNHPVKRRKRVVRALGERGGGRVESRIPAKSPSHLPQSENLRK